MSKINHWNLISKYLSGESSLEEESKLEQWRKDNFLNEQLFIEAKQIWDTTPHLKVDLNPDIDVALLRLKNQFEKTKTKKTKIIFIPKWMKIAATILLVISLGYVLKTLFNDTSLTNKNISEDIKQVEIQSTDSVLNFYLPDSSHVFLNTKSKLTYSEIFNDTARIVFLNGEGYFNVIPSEKPFIVMMDKYFVRVVGTSFNVHTADENIKVSVYSGEVEFNKKDAPDETISIKKDETITYNKTSGKISKQSNNSSKQWWKKTSSKLKNLIKQVGNDFNKSIKKL